MFTCCVTHFPCLFCIAVKLLLWFWCVNFYFVLYNFSTQTVPLALYHLPLFKLCPNPAPLVTVYLLSFSPAPALFQGEAARFPMVSEAARWLVQDAHRRGGGCQVRAEE